MIERSFETKLAAVDTLMKAWEFLRQGGFQLQDDDDISLDSKTLTSMTFTRGKQTAGAARNPLECPQEVTVSWQAHRVKLLAQIERPAPTTVESVSNLVRRLGRLMKRSEEEERDWYLALMTVIVEGLEKAIGRGTLVYDARQPWVKLEEQILAVAKYAHITNK